MVNQSVREAYSYMSEQYIALFKGDSQADVDDAALVREHLVGLDGRVLDLGCGPGQWSAYLHSFGADVTGVDLVPEFIDHAQTNFPGPEFRLGSMTDLNLPDHSVAGILSWYSTIHLPPPELDGVLTEFRRMLAPSGKLVIGFFDSADGVAAFDHATQAFIGFRQFLVGGARGRQAGDLVHRRRGAGLRLAQALGDPFAPRRGGEHRQPLEGGGVNPRQHLADDLSVGDEGRVVDLLQQAAQSPLLLRIGVLRLEMIALAAIAAGLDGRHALSPEHDSPKACAASINAVLRPSGRRVT